MTDDNEIITRSYFVPISTELLVEQADLADAFTRYMAMPAEQCAQIARERAEQRAAEREAAERQPLTLDALLDKLGFSREYAEHLVQPYCWCGDSADGWDRCSHARDEGLAP